MDLFMPSKKVLEKICGEGEKVHRMYEIYPFGNHESMINLEISYISGIYEKIKEFYLINIEKYEDRLDIQGVSNVIDEVFKNWADHSEVNQNFITGLFLGTFGVCYGFLDEGFFKKVEIKNQLENKIFFEEFNQTPRGDCNNEGYNYGIFPYSDFIEVDSEKGILYCVQLKENIIAPEGENGSSYFYNKRKKEGKG